MAITNIKTIKVKNCIVDELHVRENTDASVNLSSSKDTWQIDTYLLAKFMNNLEAGNVTNAGIQIDKFTIKRRKKGELTPMILAHLNYSPSQSVLYTDYTQANTDYIYSIVPVGINGLEGQPNDISVSSEFTGFFVVDKDTNSVLAFDKFLDGSALNVDITLNQGRMQLQTFSKYPTVYYTEESYESFSLSTVIIPSEFEKSGQKYEEIINSYINSHKPFLVKGNGRLYVCDISQPKFSTPMNTWKDHDFGILTINLTEIDSYENFISG